MVPAVCKNSEGEEATSELLTVGSHLCCGSHTMNLALALDTRDSEEWTLESMLQKNQISL